MRAIQYSGFGDRSVLVPTELPRPVPQRDELLVGVNAAGVNYVDVRERQGVYQRADTKVGGVTLPRTPGLQVCGVVRDIGPAGDPSLIGQTVMAMLSGGGYAELAIARPELTVRVPTDADPAMFAALPTQGLTAYLMMQASTVLTQGESVLVHGAGGGVGSLAVQIAKVLGAGLVIATASTVEKRGLALRAGADVVVDYEVPGWTKTVLDRTGGRGVDVLLESIGGEVFEQNFECLAPFGRYVIFGSTRGPGTPFEPRRLMQKSQTMTGIYLPMFLAKPELIHAGLTFLAEHAINGSVRPHVSHVLPLNQAAEAHRLLEERDVVGAIVLDPRRP